MATFLIRERRDPNRAFATNIDVSPARENPEFSVGNRPDVVGCRTAGE